MKPSDIGEAYNQITDLWECEKFDRLNGIEQHKKAIAFVKNRGKALDIGCGCTGRLIDLLLGSGFDPEGVDVSDKMITLAKERHPELIFYQRDICTWEVPKKYDFITAWDSIWHIPLDQQEKVLTKLVSSLEKNGVLIFSFGGTDEEGDHKDNSMGPEIYYSTLVYCNNQSVHFRGSLFVPSKAPFAENVGHLFKNGNAAGCEERASDAYALVVTVH